MSFEEIHENNILVSKNNECVSDSKKLPSLRLYVAFVSLVGCAIMYLTRVNLTVAILAMVNSTQIDYSLTNVSQPNTHINDIQCPITEVETTGKTSQVMVREFQWSPPEQGIVLGSFFYGYILPQVFAGRLSELYGAKYLVFLSIFISGLINLLTPVIVRWNMTLFIGSRVLLGVVQGILYPAFYALFAKWIPEEEHSTFMPWLDAGITIGTVIASAGAGEMIESGFLGGWPSVFYVSGILAIIWCLVWYFTITSTPTQHKWISKAELNYILSHTYSSDINTKVSKKSIPWRKILTSKAFNSTLIAKVTYGITFDFMTTKIPAYLQDVIHFPIDQNGYTYSFIMIGFAVTLLTCGFAADWVIKSGPFSKTTVRKLFQTISGVGMAATLFILPSVGCDKPWNIALLTICMLSYGFTSGGDVPIVPDMTEEFAGTVFAVMNTLCSISGFVVPYFVGVIIDSNPNSMRLWSYSFYISAIIDIFGTIVFILWASAEPQKWDVSEDSVEDVDRQSDDNTILLNRVRHNSNKTNYNSCHFSVP